MCPSIEITNEVYSRLEKHVVGFDTPSNVINRLIDSFEKQQASADGGLNSSIGCAAKGAAGRIFNNREIQKRLSEIAETLPENELELLCKEQFSKDTFGISFPLFVKVPASANQQIKKQAVKSTDGVNRWTWKFEFIRNGFAFAICTQWYPKNDPLVQKWLQSRGS